MYKVTSNMFPELQRKINSVIKKLNKYGLSYEFSQGDPEIEEVNVYKIDETGTRVKIGTRVVKVIPYTFSMETLKLGDWVPIARIEHGSLTESTQTRTNMVHPLNISNLSGDSDIDETWWSIDSNCDHCSKSRKRNTTYILQDTKGQMKQVGSTCVNEFTGIDALDILSIYTSVRDIYVEDPYEISHTGFVHESNYVETDTFLAFAIDSIDKDGYCQYITKELAFKYAQTGKPSDDLLERARNIINFFINVDLDSLDMWDNFYANTKLALMNQYTNCSGIVAYAPVAYEKILAKIESISSKKGEPESNWKGEIGEKISVDVRYDCSHTYGSEFGLMYIHLFKDEEGNVYKWNTGTSLDGKKVDGILTGTVKSHDEYAGVKQTRLLRCKIV